MQRFPVKQNGLDRSRRREKNRIEIRKNKRLESIVKSKRRDLESEEDDLEDINIQTLKVGLESGNITIQHKSILRARKLLSFAARSDEIAADFVKEDMIRPIVELLKSNNADIQFEAAWAITNVCSTSYAKYVAILGGIPLIIDLLIRPSSDMLLKDQCVWCLGNMVGDSEKHCSHVIESNGIDAIVSVAHGNLSFNVANNIAWALSNMCRHSDDTEILLKAFPVLIRFLQNTSMQICTNACWALSFFSQTTLGAQTCVEGGLVPMALRVLLAQTRSMMLPCLKILANIVSADDDSLTNVVLANHGAEILFHVINLNNSVLTKEALYVLSNITAGSEQQIMKVLSFSEEIEKLQDISLGHEVVILREEACFVFAKALSGHYPAVIEALSTPEVAKMIDEHIRSPSNSSLVLELLHSITALLEYEELYFFFAGGG
eukprot:TRINITY_DN4266_c1_g2_i2.p1 TRINITY_DN4266_c1_g2~~TRINITY_DN4266_c1_g2_i2.p1  ORF type:complete len:434 (-),score=76.08 TRINITY_DN4266_c1_g2_i2:714-2015(-)